MAEYQDLTARYTYGKILAWADLADLSENDQFLKDNGWQDATNGVFYQAAAPTGWTKDVTTNDKMLRVVSGAGGGTGGTLATATAISLAHTAHSIANSGTHTHNASSHTHTLATSGEKAQTNSGSGTIYSSSGFLKAVTSFASIFQSVVTKTLSPTGTVTTGAGGGHDHGGNTTGAALTDITLAYADVIVCTKDTSTGYTDETGTYSHNVKIDREPLDILADNDEFNRLRLMPSTSVMIFGQAVAPTGWALATTVNDKALRVVSGAGGGTGGSRAISAGVPMSHSHTTATDTGHTHSVPAHIVRLGNSGNGTVPGGTKSIHIDASNILRASDPTDGTLGSETTAAKDSSGTDGAGTTDSNGSHTHTVGTSGTDIYLAYLDVIQATKSATGSPQSYTDMTAVFTFKKLLSRQRLTKMAANDAYVNFHTPPSATRTFFFMAAAPLSWTKLTAQTDKALRIVSGAGGGTGGTQALGTALPLAHTHSLSSVSHTHAIGSHTHTLAKGTDPSAFVMGTNPVVEISAGGDMRTDFPGTVVNGLSANTSGATGSTDSASHDHSGVTGSALTDITLAYADVIFCEKD